MLMLDTTILIDALYGKKAALERLWNWKRPKKLYAPHKSMCWSYTKAHTSPKSDDAVQKISKLLDASVVFPIDEETYECFAASSNLAEKR